MSGAGVIGSITADGADLLVSGDLVEKLRQDRSIAGAVVADFDGPDIQRISVNSKM